ncbi:MAG: hypothetical protein M3310_03965 [Actinomycetota bacterium]|nr:hypothetical protein [Actinomycetota bacterium]
MAEPNLAFAIQEQEPPVLEVRVNFGVFAGRAATAAEIDELAADLLPEVGRVTVVSEERHEIDDQSEAAIHQVRIEVPADALPAEPAERERLARQVVEAAERWAAACIAERHAEVSEL